VPVATDARDGVTMRPQGVLGPPSSPLLSDAGVPADRHDDVVQLAKSGMTEDQTALASSNAGCVSSSLLYPAECSQIRTVLSAR